MSAAVISAEQMLTVQVGDRYFALPAVLVDEVASLPRMSRVPNAPSGLLGLANVRGAVVPVLSLARLLLHKDDDAAKRLVVVHAGEPVGLAVDAVRRLGADGSQGASRIDVADLVARCIPVRAKAGAGRGAVVAEHAEHAEQVALVAFRVANQDFALPLTSVDEVLRIPAEIALLPHGDAVVVGSAAFRGITLPLLSLSALLALPMKAVNSQSRVVVVRIGRNQVGFVADEMRSVIWIDPADIDPVPHVLTRGNAESKIQAICRLDFGKRLVSVLSADQLLRDDITQRLLQGGSGADETMVSSAGAAPSEQFLVFRIGDEEFGLPIAAVEEIAPLPPKLTPLPKAPAFIQGVMNLRGQVIPVIDQARRFNRGTAAGAKRRVVVVRIGDLRAGFIVDAVSEVLRVGADELRPAPDLGTEGTRVFDRVANLQADGKLVLIVSPRELLDRAEQDLLIALGRKGASAAS